MNNSEIAGALETAQAEGIVGPSNSVFPAASKWFVLHFEDEPLYVRATPHAVRRLIQLLEVFHPTSAVRALGLMAHVGDIADFAAREADLASHSRNCLHWLPSSDFDMQGDAATIFRWLKEHGFDRANIYRRRTMFLSSRMLRLGVATGHVTFDQLADGLFALDTTPEILRIYAQSVVSDKPHMNLRSLAPFHKSRFLLALALAELEGRLVYITDGMTADERTSAVNGLLERNGYERLSASLHEDDTWQRDVANQLFELNVHWRLEGVTWHELFRTGE